MSCLGIIKGKMLQDNFSLKYYVQLTSNWGLHLTGETTQDTEADRFFFKPLALLIDKRLKRGYYIQSCENGVLKIGDGVIVDTNNSIDSQMVEVFKKLTELDKQKILKKSDFNGFTTYLLEDKVSHRSLEPISCNDLGVDTSVIVDSRVFLKLDDTRSIKTGRISITNVTQVYDKYVNPRAIIYSIFEGHLIDLTTNKEYMITFYCANGKGYKFAANPTTSVYYSDSNDHLSIFALYFSRNLKLIKDSKKNIHLVNDENISDLKLIYTEFINISQRGLAEARIVISNYIDQGYFLKELTEISLPKETSLSIPRKRTITSSSDNGEKQLKISPSREFSSLVGRGSSISVGHEILARSSELDIPMDVDEKIFGYNVGFLYQGFDDFSQHNLAKWRLKRKFLITISIM